jgi:hypothetical protein
VKASTSRSPPGRRPPKNVDRIPGIEQRVNHDPMFRFHLFVRPNQSSGPGRQKINFNVSSAAATSSIVFERPA